MLLTIIMSIENDDDREYLLAIYYEYYPLMKSKAIKVVKDDLIAEDILQDAVIKLIPHLAMLRTLKKSLVVSYICKTVNSVAIDYFRKYVDKQSKAFFSDEDALLENVEDTEPLPSERYERFETYEELGKAVMKLSQKDQEILSYKYNMGFSDQQIAETMGIKCGNVRTSLNRAKARLRKILLQEEV